jgi:hypothetical protein
MKRRKILRTMVLSIGNKQNDVIVRNGTTKQCVFNNVKRLLHPDESGIAMTVAKKFGEIKW